MKKVGESHLLKDENDNNNNNKSLKRSEKYLTVFVSFIFPSTHSTEYFEEIKYTKY